MITGVGHVAVGVSDLDAALTFYRDGLGFDEVFHLDRDGQLWLLYLRAAPHQFIELFPDQERASISPGGTGYKHICLTVDDIHATIAVLSERGVAISAEPQLGPDGNWEAWIVDPDGNRIELMQILPDSAQAKAAG